MAKKSKQARAREFSPAQRKKIKNRDRDQCIFCMMGYQMNVEEYSFEMQIKSIMHFIPRSQGGLGIEQNGAIGCHYHHHMFDNGTQGNRGEMKELFKEYLKRFYKDWNEEALVYNKWR